MCLHRMEKNEASGSPYLMVRHDGRVIMDNNLKLVSTCSIDIHKFPFDTQNCNLTFSSSIYTGRTLTLESKAAIHTGRTLTLEHKAAIHTGKTLTLEHKAAIHAGRTLTLEHKAAPFTQVELVHIADSLSNVTKVTFKNIT